MPYNHLHTKSVTIANGQTLSSVLSLDGLFALVGIITPASWTDCDITVEGSMDERDQFNSAWAPATWYEFFDSTSNEVTIQANSTSRGIMLSQDVLMAGKHFRFTCSDAQGGARTVVCIFRPVG